MLQSVLILGVPEARALLFGPVFQTCDRIESCSLGLGFATFPRLLIFFQMRNAPVNRSRPYSSNYARAIKPYRRSRIARVPRNYLTNYKNTPELRHQVYNAQIAVSNVAPIACINTTFLISLTAKLYRIRVSWIDVGVDLGQPVWGILYSPKQGYAETDLPSTPANELENYGYDLDNRKQRVWCRHQFDANNVGFQVYSWEKTFSIPMVIGNLTENTQNQSAVHNQVFFIGSPANEPETTPRNLLVTLYYTDN